jgi:O-acetyl-ADP-ribose deacetylase (regulator of RNase III)
MQTIIGDILNIEKGFICHQVNCLGAVGGLAGAIAAKWPEWHKHYIGTHNKQLGLVTVHPVIEQGELKKDLYIVSLYAQYGAFAGKVETNYYAFHSCLSALKQGLDMKGKDSLQIYFPYKIGCGLGGGNWEIVSEMIEDVFPDACIVRLPET